MSRGGRRLLVVELSNEEEEEEEEEVWHQPQWPLNCQPRTASFISGRLAAPCRVQRLSLSAETAFSSDDKKKKDSSCLQGGFESHRYLIREQGQDRVMTDPMSTNRSLLFRLRCSAAHYTLDCNIYGRHIIWKELEQGQTLQQGQYWYFLVLYNQYFVQKEDDGSRTRMTSSHPLLHNEPLLAN